MPAVVELLTILQSHDRLRLLFADLLGTAPRLADTVAQSPHVLDALIDPAFVDPLSDEAGIEEQVRQIIGQPADYEDFLDRARDAARQMRFVTGARLLSESSRRRSAGEAYAAIARAIVRASFEEVRARISRRITAVVPGAEIAILGTRPPRFARADGGLRSRPRGDLRFRRGAAAKAPARASSTWWSITRA